MQACVLGGLFGVFYDCFRLFRLAFPSGKRMIFWQDGLFFLLMAVLLFRFTLRLCDGRLRFFVLVGSMLGFILYYGTVGALVYRFAKWTFGGVRKFLSKIWRGIASFFQRLFGHFKLKPKYDLGHNDKNTSK